MCRALATAHACTSICAPVKRSGARPNTYVLPLPATAAAASPRRYIIYHSNLAALSPPHQPPAAPGAAMHQSPCSHLVKPLENPIALPEMGESIQDATCDGDEEEKGKGRERMVKEKKHKKEKRKRKRQEDEIGMVVEKGKNDNKEEKVKKGNAGGILTNKTFSELYISEFTAKAIREMNYTHLTEVINSRLRLNSLVITSSLWRDIYFVFSVQFHNYIQLIECSADDYCIMWVDLLFGALAIGFLYCCNGMYAWFFT